MMNAHGILVGNKNLFKDAQLGKWGRPEVNLKIGLKEVCRKAMV
jgi:hypothetical protein